MKASTCALLLGFLLSVLVVASPLGDMGRYSPVEGALLQGSIYAGGYAGSVFRPSPVALIVNSSRAVVYTWNASGMVVSVRASGRGAIMSGFIRGEGGVSGLVSVFQDIGVRSFALEGDADIYVADGILDNGSLVVAGYFSRRGSRDLDVFVARVTLEGGIAGVKCYGSPDYPDTARRIIAGSDGYYVLGETWAYNVSQSDVLLLKLGRDLSLKDSLSVGGAGIDTGEDLAITRDGDYVFVGATEVEGVKLGFVTRVSSVGGLLWLRGYRTLGDTFLKRLWLDPSAGRVYVIGSGTFEEGRREPFVLVLDELWGWVFNESQLVVARTEPFLSLSGDISGGRVILFRSGGVSLVGPGDRATDYVFGPTSLNRTLVLDDTPELPYYAKAIYGWRVLKGVVSSRVCPEISVRRIDPSVSTISIEYRELVVERKPFERRLDVGLVIRRFVERNIPVFLLLPVLVAFLAIVYSTLRSTPSARRAGTPSPG
ncbi:hypothetical protein IG193_06790 [Infirmifilum lucidum]|uniref:Uncharacterized protein n=1 Tax=Infirmifilum lucidum TaxID=2776706 RepID=A0A7L9FFK3_9CREN|nr:hypothetical protein [Infirmifilum lucidum]QOJ78457.1 hypothetical protein IG193_06790 [Infirmifilum lucidum]